MSSSFVSSYHNPKPYIPASLSEIDDLLGAMMLDAPTFIDESGTFPERNLDSRFHQLTQAFAVVRKKLGDERHAKLVDLAARAKALFAADQEDTNGKTDQGRKLLYEMEDVIGEVRKRRVAAKMKDDDGEISGD